MDPITAKLMSAGGAAADRIYVNDVFSTFLYDGTGSAQTITNGIDLDGEGGMVWIKSRSARNHVLNDTERGAGNNLFTNLNIANDVDSTSITSFNSNGFSIGTSAFKVNTSSEEFCSWTFRKCPGFFDIVTWTGDGTAGRQISHSIGSTPGFVIVKRTDAGTTNWHTWHRSHGDNKRLDLNANNSGSSSSDYVRTASSTTFTVGSDYDVNGNNGTFVAYIFAHNDQSFGAAGNEAAIHCGSYTANESTNGVEIDCGFEAQWVMVKNIDAGENWVLVDDLRGFSPSKNTSGPMNGNTGKFFAPNSSGSENTGRTFVSTPDGFKVTSTAGAFGSNNTDYIYIAVAKNNKVPEAGSEVFETNIGNSVQPDSGAEFEAGFPVDMFVYRNIAGGGSGNIQSHNLITRKYRKAALYTNRGEDMNHLHTPGNEALLDNNHGAYIGTLDSDHCAWMWRTAPGFFDVTNYWNGDDTNNRAIKHNLRAVPKMMWIKSAVDADSVTRNWCVYHESLGNTKKLVLNSSAAATNTSDFSSTSPTATNFTVGAEVSVNKNAEYIAFMFGEVEGVSKIGSYTGNGTNQNIDCGFSAGARFILIKRTDASGDWLQFDTERGINAGAEDADDWRGSSSPTSADSIDTFSSGFNVVQNSTHNLNVSSATYVFYAIS